VVELEIVKGNRLAGKCAIVTGAGSGIGQATARLFAAQGAALVMTDIDEAALAGTLEQIEAQGGSAITMVHDIASEQDWQRIIGLTVEQLGRIDVLVNIAGIHPRAHMGDITLEDWNRIIAVDLTGPFLGTQSVLPEMLRIGGGSIVNVSSVSALIAGPFAHYNAAKAGVRAMTKSTAFKFAKDHIRANTVLPGLIETNMTKIGLADPERRAYLQRNIPMPNFGQAIDIAYGIVYLASDEARFVTGSDMVIDGGRTL
jgi:NAD(P)-dependent dehydrogenase (short-subunit alcohol dehydrogenase family)